MSDVKFPNIDVQLSGEDGNAFNILGRVKQAMQRGGCSADDVKAFMDDAMSGDYNHLLRVAMDTVNVL